MNAAPTRDWIVHLCPRQAWSEALHAGVYCPSSLVSAGFIHCSRPSQVIAVANQFYRDTSDLVLLWIDPGQLSSELHWEAVDGQLFPHIYGPLYTPEVLAVKDFLADADGVFRQAPEL